MYKLFKKQKARVQLIEEKMIGDKLIHVIVVREVYENTA